MYNSPITLILRLVQFVFQGHVSILMTSPSLHAEYKRQKFPWLQKQSIGTKRLQHLDFHIGHHKTRDMDPTRKMHHWSLKLRTLVYSKQTALRSGPTNILDTSTDRQTRAFSAVHPRLRSRHWFLLWVVLLWSAHANLSTSLEGWKAQITRRGR